MHSESHPLPNGGLWPDVAGTHVNAHGGGLLKEGGLWYWYGEHKTAGRAGNVANVGVRVYSSPDLLAWTDRGVALAVEPDEASDIAHGCILERPKVVKAATGRFVMFFHLERKGLGYTDARVGIAVADHPEGPFAFIRSLRPHGEFCRDMTLFRDDDGSTWHVFASEDNATLHVAELTPDCLDYTGRWWRMAKQTWTEAPAVFKHDGRYAWLPADFRDGRLVISWRDTFPPAAENERGFL